MVTIEDEDNNNSESSATTTTRNNKRKRLLKQKQIITTTTTITVSKPFSNLPPYTLKKVGRTYGKTQQLKLSK